MARTDEQYKQLSIKEFTKAADVYETDHAGIYEMCRKDYPPILEELKKRPFKNLLDVGCGTGPMIELLLEEFDDIVCTGLDLTPRMIEVASAKGLPHARFVVGDSENMPFENESFDAVICANSFHHYPNPDKFIAEVHRVLQPGGIFVLRDYTSASAVIWLMNHIEMPLAHLAGHGDVRAYTIKQVRSLVERVGLVIQTLEPRAGFRLHMVALKP